MIIRAYSVKDAALKAFLPPFWARTDGEASRSFMQACVTGSLKNNSDDYELFQLGEFDDSSGLLLARTPPHFITNGHQAIAIYEQMIQKNRPRTIEHEHDEQRKHDLS